MLRGAVLLSLVCASMAMWGGGSLLGGRIRQASALRQVQNLLGSSGLSQNARRVGNRLTSNGVIGQLRSLINSRGLPQNAIRVGERLLADSSMQGGGIMGQIGGRIAVSRRPGLLDTQLGFVDPLEQQLAFAGQLDRLDSGFLDGAGMIGGGNLLGASRGLLGANRGFDFGADRFLGAQTSIFGGRPFITEGSVLRSSRLFPGGGVVTGFDGGDGSVISASRFGGIETTVDGSDISRERI